MPSDPKTKAAAPIETIPDSAARLKAASHITNPPASPGPLVGPSGPATGPGGGPSTGPSGGPGTGTGDTGTGTGGGPGTGTKGTSAGNGTNNGPGTSTDTGSGSGLGSDVDHKIADSLLQLIENATTGDAQEAQNLILRRIALQGDVVPSRVPPPRNVTEIGGYLNLLGTLKEYDMRSQALAGILGVAGSNPPAGWISSAHPLSLAPIVNDRPAGAVQSTLPVTVMVRSDFIGPLQTALQSLHDQGCLVPFLSGPFALPRSGMNAPPPADPLPYLGRVLLLATATALVDPATDTLALVRAQGSTDPFQIAARVLNAGTTAVAPANYEAIRCTTTACTPIPLPGAKFVYIAPALANAGFYPASPLPQPAALKDTAWARLTNITGLVAGTTKLGDELSLLYSWDIIANSVFSDMLNQVWNGSTFASPA